jgi:hypothetical protein
MPHTLRERLVGLYAELVAHTKPECSGKCERPYSCCEEKYCAFAIAFAERNWNVALETTTHAVLPLMGEKGCTAAPHLRPMCSAHTCEVCAYGAKRNDPAWTERYHRLIDDIAAIESLVLQPGSY